MSVSVCSSVAGASIARAVTWAQLSPASGRSHSQVSSLRKPMRTRASTSSGKPWYRSVPRISVSASGMPYSSRNGVESRFGYATKANEGMM